MLASPSHSLRNLNSLAWKQPWSSISQRWSPQLDALHSYPFDSQFWCHRAAQCRRCPHIWLMSNHWYWYWWFANWRTNEWCLVLCMSWTLANSMISTVWWTIYREYWCPGLFSMLAYSPFREKWLCPRTSSGRSI